MLFLELDLERAVYTFRGLNKNVYLRRSFGGRKRVSSFVQTDKG